MKKIVLTAILFTTFSATGTAQKYSLKNYQHERITIDSRFDGNANSQAARFIAQYKEHVDSIMAPVVGHAAKDMQSTRPESEMPNLLSDILAWSAEHTYNEHVDFALYNIGGIRSVFSKGAVTVGDVIDVAPFENKICFMTMQGADVIELFGQIAKNGGEGVSSGVRCVIRKDGSCASVSINGKTVDNDATYRIATIDYLAEGNDGLKALRKGRDMVAPKDERSDTRFIIMDYFRSMESEGKYVDTQIEGRISYEE